MGRSVRTGRGSAGNQNELSGVHTTYPGYSAVMVRSAALRGDVPGRTLLALVARRSPEWAHPTVWNHAMPGGTGVLLGGLRGICAATGLRGPRANLVHTVVRLASDQTFDNAVVMGVPPWAWPRQKQTIHILHKAIYSFVTGWITDRVITSSSVAKAGTISH